MLNTPHGGVSFDLERRSLAALYHLLAHFEVGYFNRYLGDNESNLLIAGLLQEITDVGRDTATATQRLTCPLCAQGTPVVHMGMSPAYWHRVEDHYEDCAASEIIQKFDLAKNASYPIGTGINKGAYPQAYPDPYRGVPLFVAKADIQELLEFRLRSVVRLMQSQESTGTDNQEVIDGGYVNYRVTSNKSWNRWIENLKSWIDRKRTDS